MLFLSKAWSVGRADAHIAPNFDSSGGILILIERLVYVETMS